MAQTGVFHCCSDTLLITESNVAFPLEDSARVVLFVLEESVSKLACTVNTSSKYVSYPCQTKADLHVSIHLKDRKGFLMFFYHFYFEGKREEEAGISLEGLQVFGHGVGFYFYNRKGCASVSLWEAS